jgi:RimJ/RimL family protein N-acetyltransferase
MQKDIELFDGKVRLRPYLSGDSPDVFEAATESFHEVGEFLPWCHAGYTRKESDDWIKLCAQSWDNGSAYEFAILDSINGRYLGGCGLNHVNAIDKIANLGYWVRSSAAGHGIAPASAQLLAKFAFDKLELNRVEIVAAVENLKSQRTAEKTGARREGVLRNRILISGIPHDAVIFSLIASDLKTGV